MIAVTTVGRELQIDVVERVGLAEVGVQMTYDELFSHGVYRTTRARPSCHPSYA